MPAFQVQSLSFESSKFQRWSFFFQVRYLLMLSLAKEEPSQANCSTLVEITQDLLAITSILDPGPTKTRGIILKHLIPAWRRLAQMELDMKLIPDETFRQRKEMSHKFAKDLISCYKWGPGMNFSAHDSLASFPWMVPWRMELDGDSLLWPTWFSIHARLISTNSPGWRNQDWRHEGQKKRLYMKRFYFCSSNNLLSSSTFVHISDCYPWSTWIQGTLVFLFILLLWLRWIQMAILVPFGQYLQILSRAYFQSPELLFARGGDSCKFRHGKGATQLTTIKNPGFFPLNREIRRRQVKK